MSIKNRSLKIFFTSGIALLLSWNTGLTQQLPVEPDAEKEKTDIEITDRLIEQFASVTSQLNAIQKDGQIEMIDAIDHQGLTIDKFNEMVNMEEYPEGEETKAISREDKIAYDNAKKQVDQIQSETEQRMDEAILEAGLSMDEYEAVRRAYKEDTDVQKRVDRQVSGKQ